MIQLQKQFDYQQITITVIQLLVQQLQRHEVGHAIQDAKDYNFMRVRHSLVPVANFGSNMSWIFVLIGIFAQMSGLLLLGIILMAAGVVFQLVTLPVEFDASKRAMQQIEALGIVSTDEYGQARKVLNAADINICSGTDCSGI